MVPTDAATCGECVRELFNPADRRYRYPFISCANCGPRATIITEVPHDASLLVVGRPRHGHLGRLADALLREARYPVAVVPLSREVTP
ncbi:hypothetical protein AB0B45_32100 [Nonomuraea sp. NPDC049152]|uniref:hypothetical protein n=1 Tax=Nonomuraea sp. NPDC049152 TaxID=3154350 RepID=UPI0033DA91E9